MATLRNRIELEDGMTPVLNSIRQKLDRVVPGFSAIKVQAHDAATRISTFSQSVVNDLGNVSANAMKVENSIRGIPDENVSVRIQQTGASAKQIAQKLKAIPDENVAVNIEETGASAEKITRELAGIPDKTVRVKIEPPVGVENADNAVDGIIQRLRGGVTNAARGAGSAVVGFFGKFTLATVAADYVTKLLNTIAGVPGKVAAWSDEYSGIMARLRLITDGQEQVVALNEQVYQSALRARGSYSAMADAVSKIAMTAKEAFPDPRTVVPFMEGIQKLFAIGGTGVQQQADALLQLTQALGSDKLQGDEFRSIAEAAPMIEQMVAKYMGVTRGELKKLSSDGAITAEILKNSILGNMDEINQKFETMPKRWSDIWTELKTRATNAFAPVLIKVSELANSPAVNVLKEGIARAMEISAAVIIYAIGAAEKLRIVLYNIGSYVGTWFGASFQIIEDGFSAVMQYSDILFAGLIGGLTLYLAYLAATNIALTAWQMEEAALAVWHGITSAALAVKNGIIWVYSLRTSVAALFTRGWTIATVGLTMAQAILNAVLHANPIGLIIGLVVLVIGAFAAWAVATNGVRASIASAFRSIANIVSEVINFIIDRINDAIDAINALASGINGVFHTSIGVIGKVEHVNQAGDLGDKAYDAVMDFDIHKLMPGGLSVPGVTYDSGGSGFDMGSIPGYGDLGGLGGELAGPAGETAGNTGRTAANTAAMANTLDDLDDQLKDMRDMAEQEAINYYTRKEYSVTVGDINNSISGPQDVDGIIDTVAAYIREGVNSGAEAVHA